MRVGVVVMDTPIHFKNYHFTVPLTRERTLMFKRQTAYIDSEVLAKPAGEALPVEKILVQGKEN